MIIRDAVDAGMPQELVQQIADDLKNDNRKMMVSWIDDVTHDHSEIGGAGNLEMITTPNFIITITYEDKFTSDKQIDDSSEWMLANY